MAAQPLPIVDYSATGIRVRSSPVRNQPPQQLFWDQVGEAVAPVAPESQVFAVSVEQQPVIGVMAQPEAGIIDPFTKNWSAVLAEIDAVAAGTEDEVRATEYAFARARSTAESVYRQIKPTRNVPQIVPEHSVTTDDVGGIRLAWRLGPKQVRANFGADANLRSYIYFESPLEHQVEALDVEHLAERLAWLTAK